MIKIQNDLILNFLPFLILGAVGRNSCHHERLFVFESRQKQPAWPSFTRCTAVPSQTHHVDRCTIATAAAADCCAVITLVVVARILAVCRGSVGM